MKKLTHADPKHKKEANSAKKSVENVTKTSDAKCCAKTSKNSVGCHD